MFSCWLTEVHSNIELFAFLSFPFSPCFLGEIRRRIKICASKIQNKWTHDNRHFDNEQLVVNADQLRNIEPQNFADASISQSFIHRTLTLKRFGGAM